MYIKIARLILRAEPIITLINITAIWYPAPPRDQWAWLLLLFIPIWAARYVVYGRVLTPTPMAGVMVAFLGLGLLNPFIAPYTRGHILLVRPILGIVLYYGLVEAARQDNSMRRPMLWATGLALLLAVLALGATQWNEKVRLQIPGVIQTIPVLRGFPGAERGFNANEIAGAIVYFIVLAAGAGVYAWRFKQAAWYRWLLTVIFVMLVVALSLGQSRTALIGVTLAFSLIIVLSVPAGTWRRIAWGALGLFVLFQVAMYANWFNPAVQEQLRERDENSLEGRFNMWKAGFDILRDYPLTGVGSSMFRDNRVRDAYPIPRYEDRNPPHIHNEVLQAGMDMGLPGMAVFLSFYGVAAYMLVKVWRRGDAYLQALAAAVGAGLLAHAVYGLADAVTLWDRFAFLFWIMLGLAGALYVIEPTATEPSQS